MKDNQEPYRLSLDFRKSRIRVPANVLSSLGNPEYIQLIVNPDTKCLAITLSSEDDYLSRKVCISPGRSYVEFRSTPFVESLLMLYRGFDTSFNYWINGHYLSTLNIAIFSLGDNTRIPPVSSKRFADAI